MSKQSLSAVPPDVARPEVLKRFLSRLIEELDIVLGFRGTGKDKYVSQQELNSAAETLSSLSTGLSEVSRRFQQLRKDLEQLSADSDIFLARLAQVEADANAAYVFASTQAWLKMYFIDFIGRSTNGAVTVSSSYNVASANRVGAGRYDITFTANSFLSTAIQDSKTIVELLVAPTATSSLFTVETKWNASTLELYVWQHTISGTDLVRAAYDPITLGDRISLVGLMPRPSTGVP